MTYIILLLLLLNFSLFYSTLFNKKIGQTIFFTIVSYIFILFVFGIFNALYIGFVIILILNLCLLFFNGYNFYRKKIDFKNNIFTTGLLLFLVSYIFIIWSSSGKLASEWDEFSHWALVVKNMFKLNNLGLWNDSTVLFKWYLSGTSIFQYFCMCIAGEFKESMMYVGMNLILISLIIPAFELIKKNCKVLMFILFFILFFIPTFFYPTLYTSLYVDGVLGLCFAYTLYSYFCIRKKALTKFDLINLAFCFSMLIFIKDFGLIFMGLAFAIIIIDNTFIMNKFEIKTLIKNNYKIALTVIPALIIKLSWVLTLNRLYISSGDKESSILSTVLNILKLNILDYQEEVFLSFTSAIGTKSLTETTFMMSYFIIIVLLFIIGYLIYVNVTKSNKKRVQVYTCTTIFCGIMYALLLMLCYLSIFSEYEAVRLASYARYMGSFAMGSIFAFLVILMVTVSIKSEKFAKYLIIILFVFAINIRYENLLAFFSGPIVNKSLEIRDDYNTFEEKVNKHVKLNEKVYFISTDNNGFDYYTAKYVIAPKKMNTKWSIGYPYNEGDIWTIFIEQDELKKELLADYDYVYLYDIDDPFIKLYGDLFYDSNIQDNQLYKVNKNETDKILYLVN